MPSRQLRKIKSVFTIPSFYQQFKETIWKLLGSDRDEYLLDILANCKEMLELKKLAVGCTVTSLDIGCGRGNLTKRLREQYGLETTALDHWKSFVFDGTVLFLVADASFMPFEAESFRLVTAFSTIEHIREEERKRFYEEIKTVLADGGFFIMQFPNRYFPIEQHSFLPLVGFLPSRMHGIFYPEYVSVPSKRNVIEELTKEGFSVRAIPYGLPFLKTPAAGYISKVMPFGFLIIAKRLETSPSQT